MTITVQYLTLEQAYLQAFGVVPSTQTLHRNFQRGLKALKIGGKWMTTVANVIEFEEAKADLRRAKPLPAIGKTSSPSVKAKRMAKAAAELDKAGI